MSAPKGKVIYVNERKKQEKKGKNIHRKEAEAKLQVTVFSCT